MESPLSERATYGHFWNERQFNKHHWPKGKTAAVNRYYQKYNHHKNGILKLEIDNMKSFEAITLPKTKKSEPKKTAIFKFKIGNKKIIQTSEDLNEHCLMEL